MQTFAPDGHDVPDLVASAEALRILGLKSRTSLQLLVESGRLRAAARTGLGRLFHRSDVERLAAERNGSAA